MLPDPLPSVRTILPVVVCVGQSEVSTRAVIQAAPFGSNSLLTTVHLGRSKPQEIVLV